MDDELEAVRKKELKRLNKHDRYLAALGAASDQDFNQYMSEEIARHELRKAREEQPVPEHERELNRQFEASKYENMSSAEFNDALAEIPDDGRPRIAGRGVELTLDEAMSVERKRRGQ